MTTIAIPEFALVVLVGASGSGKSTFARKHFTATEIVSSDACRGIVADDENALDASADAFALVHTIIDIRLRRRRLTVVDATNVRPEDRKKLIEAARKHHALAAAIVIDPGEDVSHSRNALRSDRQFGPHVVRNQRSALRRGLRGLEREGFRQVTVLTSLSAVDAAQIVRTKLWTDKREETGPFDIIGDVHGCADELEALLEKLGYAIARNNDPALGTRYAITHPQGRRVVFVGDLVDRGPRVGDCLRIAMDMVESGTALCVIGNHEAKVEKWLRGRDVQIKHGLDTTIADIEAGGPEFRARVAKFIGRLVSHYMLDRGRLAVAHAGLKAEYMNRASAAIRAFCMYGETTGESDEFGLPVRLNWAADYRADTKVIYGHTPVVEAEWLNNTLCIDTGCVFGGKLTALRYPELDQVSVPARMTYMVPTRPLAPARTLSAQQEHDTSLDLADVTGKRFITTRFMANITVREENAAAALETMVRFGVDPRWMIYLPPTMSPSETSAAEGYLEHPREALEFFSRAGQASVICEEKHMGSRAVLVVARDAEAARSRFGVTNGAQGMIYTRSGRPFFANAAEMREAIARTAQAVTAAGLFEELETSWLCLDSEIMPWSAKAQSLIQEQYGPVGAAARTSLGLIAEATSRSAARGIEIGAWAGDIERRRDNAARFAAAVRQYCWPTSGLDGVRIAPFHLLASEGRVHHDKPHAWHMTTLARLADQDTLFQATRTRMVDLGDAASVDAACAWWLDLTAGGGEGMVVKPATFLARGVATREGSDGRLLQPAVKCRGRDYLRIIYGPDYDLPENLVRLRKRGLNAKRSLAMREFTLGLEALERFVAREPLRRVHECVFAVLALESEPVDPRL